MVNMNRTLIGFLALAALGLLAACNRPSASAVGENPGPADTHWLTDYQQALKLAAEQKKTVLLDFTGSDWCPYCIQLKRQVFDTAEFQRFARQKLVLVEIDFPRAKPQSPDVARQNEKLQNQFRVRGFPTLILLNPDGQELKRSEGLLEGGVKGFLKWVES